MKKLAFPAVLLASLLMVRIAYAGANEEARRHFDRAVELVDDGQMEGALLEFQRSYAANVSFIAGGALVALGAVAIIFGTPDQAAAGSGDHACLLPSIGPRSTGLAAGGTR